MHSAENEKQLEREPAKWLRGGGVSSNAEGQTQRRHSPWLPPIEFLLMVGPRKRPSLEDLVQKPAEYGGSSNNQVPNHRALELYWIGQEVHLDVAYCTQWPFRCSQETT